MERNPSVFKISQLIAQRKKHIQDSAFAKNSGGVIDEPSLVYAAEFE